MLSLPGLTDDEQSSLAKLLAQVRAKFDRPDRTSATTKTRRMIPGIIQQEIQQNNVTKQRHSDKSTVTWACVPYFSLDRYGDKIALGEGSHPKRTLSQTRFAFAEKQRDMQQAVCNLPDSEPGFCYHVAQVWYIIVGDCEYFENPFPGPLLTCVALLVTCSQLPMTDLRGKYIPVKIISSPDPYKDEQRKLIVKFGNAVLWSFPLDECQTWFVCTTCWKFWLRSPLKLIGTNDQVRRVPTKLQIHISV